MSQANEAQQYKFVTKEDIVGASWEKDGGDALMSVAFRLIKERDEFKKLAMKAHCNCSERIVENEVQRILGGKK